PLVGIPVLAPYRSVLTMATLIRQWALLRCFSTRLAPKTPPLDLGPSFIMIRAVTKLRSVITRFIAIPSAAATLPSGPSLSSVTPATTLETLPLDLKLSLATPMVMRTRPPALLRFAKTPAAPITWPLGYQRFRQTMATTTPRSVGLR